MCENTEERSLDNLCPIKCKIGSEISEDGVKQKGNQLPENSSGAKPKRKSRASRRRLHAMMSNVSLHFSDTDSEGELSMVPAPLRSLSPAAKRTNSNNIPQPPMISVTIENADGEIADSHWDGFGEIETNTRRSSFAENLTDVDEIYVSESDVIKPQMQGGLKVAENTDQGETDMEDLSNDEGEDGEDSTPVYMNSGVDILREFGGGTITTKEGDGPFSVEVRQQMSFDESDDVKDLARNKIVFPEGPATDSEEYEVSDEDDEIEGACGQRNMMEDFDFLAPSEISMKNVSKMTNSLTVPDLTDDCISDCHTDVEDLE